MFIYIYICFLFFVLGVLGPWEFLWRAGSYIFCVCDSAVWSVGPVQFYLGTFLERMAGLYRFFLSSGSAVAGTVRFNWRGGMVRLHLDFFSLLSVLLAVGCPW